MREEAPPAASEDKSASASASACRPSARGAVGRGLARACVVVLLLAPPRGFAAGLVSDRLAVSGMVMTVLDLDVDDLRAFPSDQVANVDLTRRVGGETVASRVRGVRLTAVLERAGLAARDRNDWKHALVLATATDGYGVVFSWPELFNTDVGTGAWVVFERDGQALADGEGRIALVSTRDLQTGPRSVRWLARLAVRIVDE